MNFFDDFITEKFDQMIKFVDKKEINKLPMDNIDYYRMILTSVIDNTIDTMLTNNECKGIVSNNLDSIRNILIDINTTDLDIINYIENKQYKDLLKDTLYTNLDNLIGELLIKSDIELWRDHTL